ncbi:hypothetical protein JKP88DRAFT_281212 [Tribonema minus]|uniref:Uncharacterized protein n=1 Tax=Tribonema minus TaxID=303371 RepID=A0A835YMZ5_9STRA|nr:hypothetical protein JKP88DRAFT_281212 [Tribonema minus]
MKVTAWMTAAAAVGLAVVPCGSLDWNSDKVLQGVAVTLLIRVILYISLYTPWCAKHLCRASLDTTSGANSGDPFYFVSDYEPFCIAECASDCSSFYSDQWDGFSELSKDLFYMEYVGGKVPGGTVPGGNLP